jgi:selenocysteine lyase/cysteine desulfurase
MDRYGLAGTTRASLALYNGDEDVDALLTGVADVVRRLGRT